MRKTKSTKKKVVRKTGRSLTDTLYSYVQPTNAEYARDWGKRHFGSFSAYVNALIHADRINHFSKEWIGKINTRTNVVTMRTRKATRTTHARAA